MALKHAKQPKKGCGDVKRTTKVDPGLNHSFGITSVKIKVGKHKARSIRDAPYPYVNPEWVQDNFARKYHFRKTPTGRSPLSAFEHAHYVKGEKIDPHAHPLEKYLEHGHAHEFKCHKMNSGNHQGKKTCGRLRLSGHPKAHQIGKR